MNRLDRPADTRMMAIVHRALRRDLDRVRAELTTRPYPEGRQRQAIGEHAVWLMGFLHRHHTGEDEGLWPLLLRRNPGAANLVASLEADHRRVSPAIEALSASSRQYATSTDDEPREELLARLEQLLTVLVPHLDREVDEGMPVVAASLTQRDWRTWDQAYNLRGKSRAELGFEGHWLLDDLDPDGYQVVVHVVPPGLRFVLLHGYAGRYRRRAASLWRDLLVPTAAR